MEMVLAHPEMILLKQTSASTVVPEVFGCFPVMIQPLLDVPHLEYGTLFSGICVPAGSSNLYQLDPLQSGLMKNLSLKESAWRPPPLVAFLLL